MIFRLNNDDPNLFRSLDEAVISEKSAHQQESIFRLLFWAAEVSKEAKRQLRAYVRPGHELS
jgi:hypothetical protein